MRGNEGVPDAAPSLSVRAIEGGLEFAALGRWNAAHANALDQQVAAAGRQRSAPGRIAINANGLEELDTFGACLIYRLMRDLAVNGRRAQLVGLPEPFQGLFDEVDHAHRFRQQPLR